MNVGLQREPRELRWVANGPKVLHLPPEATPLTIVLVNVPMLTQGEFEHWSTLCNRSLHYLTGKTGLTSELFRDFRMARRIGWVGHSGKIFEGDCVVLSFASPALVRTILNRAGSHSIRALGDGIVSLGFFYHPAKLPQFDLEGFGGGPPNLSYSISIGNSFTPSYNLDEVD